MKAEKKAVILLESQPPHMGELLQVLRVLQKYETLYICVNAFPSVMPLAIVYEMWAIILQPYATRIHIIASKLQFKSVMKSDLPTTFEDCIYLTSNRETFVHLSSMNVSIELIPRASGFNSTFYQVAYRQSRALDWLENKFVNSNPLENIKR